MSTELQEPDVDDLARTALDEVNATQEECGEFFGGVFDQLQSLSLELFARHKCLELNNGHKASADTSWAACREELRRASEQIERFGSNVESQLSRLTSLVTEIAAAREDAVPDSQIAALLEGMRWQQADWLQQRATLEAEVETLRSRAADQTETLHEQKRHAGRQQAELAGELKRMRSLVETLTAQLRGDPPGPAAPPADDKRTALVDAQRDGGPRNGKRVEAGTPPAVPDAAAT